MQYRMMIGVFLVLSLPHASFAQDDPLLKVLRGATEEMKKELEVRKDEVPCPEGRECVLVDSFTKADYGKEVKKYQVGSLTAGRSFSRIVVTQHIGEQHGIIVNTVKVREGGKWTAHPQGIRLAEGRTELAVTVPAGTPEIVISCDHGRGAEVRIFLERELP